MKNLIKLLIFVIIVISAVVTCPDESAHKDKIMTELNKAIGSTVNEALGDDNSLAGMGLSLLGSSFATKIASTLLDNNVEVNNYFVISTCTLNYEGKDNLLSVGIFGHVFTTFTADDIKNGIGGYLGK